MTLIPDKLAARSLPAGSEASPTAAEASLGLKFAGPGNGRPVIAEVASDSPAARQGLKAGQEVFAVNGVRVRKIDGVRQMLAEWVQPGVQIHLVVVEPQKRLPMTFAASPVTPRSTPVHPSQVYDTINGLILCAFLLVYAPFRYRDGEVLALALTLYPITRFLIERIRTDEPPIFGTGMTISQNVSLIFLVSAMALWAVILLKPKGTVFPKYGECEAP